MNENLLPNLQSAVMSARWGETQLTPDEVLNRIGPPTQELRQSPWKVFRSCLFALVLLPAGVGLLWAGVVQVQAGLQAPANKASSLEDWLYTAGFLIFGLAGVLFFLFRLRWGWSTWRNVVFFGPIGFFYRLGKRTGVLRWDEIAAVRERVIQKKVTVHGGPIAVHTPTGKASSYFVQIKNGDTIKVDDESVSNMKWFGAMLRKECLSHNIPWELKQLN